ncbi:LTA synthase family protein [Pseudomonas sp. GD04087]|uniref:LTA synthase family protein n=1 Tax=unclassified Pseudomonas TaxID=196821 RepID=UPI0024473088|nr:MULTISPECIES: LTA synthase family protein [unclassified Pseudomonas]MDH0292744.1 LTA synthase family protein [Pseudomonas sp. GD04087]MDH1050099.1 LTA synthase family protein [Pseudomonas sp. GD03903]MDH2002863.1 LTA synthase family protein [Pseudomonas sp. GD03691]
MSWIRSRRLQYLTGVAAVLFCLFALLRGVFLLGFSGLPWQTLGENHNVLRTLGIGLRFDLRLALLIVLPLMLLAWLPWLNLLRSRAVRCFARVYLALAVGLVLLVHILDFGHYAYLGVRINATVLRFIEDAQISTGMVWQTYPVIWISLGWLACLMLTLAVLWQLERRTLQRPGTPISRGAVAAGAALVSTLVFLGLLGRLDNLNLENPVPLRWSDAFYSGDAQIAALGLNPVVFLYDTLRVDPVAYDEAEARKHYPLMASYLGIDSPDEQALDYRRQQPAQASALAGGRQPNVIFVMLESLGTSAVGAYGNPLKPTPNLDRIAREGWFFRHFYVPVTGTAKTVWASITGVPDVTREQTATRNPLISRQHSLINALDGYEKFYMIGGNAGWANINALIQRGIDGVRLYEERHWKAPLVDVWGISDLDFFKEGTAILRQLPREQPFFAYLQTSGNHRPFTIPRDNDGFRALDLPLEQVQAAGSRSLEQFNAVRLLDFNIGKLLEMAERDGYLDNTIFVFFGDHNTRISQIPHMAPGFEQLGLESNNVPLMIYAPGLLKPREFNEAVGLADLLPTVLGLLGKPYVNGGMGRDLQQPAPEGERVVPLVLREGTFPLIGGVTRRFLLQMQHDGSAPTLHDIYSPTPMDNVAGHHPEEFQRLAALTRAMHETSRAMLYRNVRE